MPHIFTILKQTRTFKPIGIYLINDAVPILYCPYHSLTLPVSYFIAETNVAKDNKTLETIRVPIIDNILLFYYLNLPCVLPEP